MTELKDRFAELPAARQKLLLRRLKARQESRGERLRPSPRRRSGEPFPLSASQERLWFLDQLTPGTAAFNIPTGLRLVGDLDPSLLAAALAATVRRHESLRTVFPAVDDRAVQKVLPHLEVPLPLIDLRRLAATARQATARRLLHQAAATAFDIAGGPLVRATLVRLADRQHLLILVIHHIVADGWSLAILQRDLVRSYAAAQGAPVEAAAPLPVQYADFADWQQQWLAGDGPMAQIDHWRRQLEGVPILELPPDRPRPRVQTFRGDSLWIELPEAATAGLRRLAQQEDAASLFMVLLAGFKALLYRYTGQDDLAVGTFIAGRNRPEIEDLIGFFVNNLTLRTRLSGRLGFRRLLADVRGTTLAAYAHQDVPFEKLLEILQPERDMSRPSLFQIMCVLQNTPAGEAALPGLAVEPVHLDGGQSNFDLTAWFHEVGDGALGRVRGQLQYNADLYDRATIERFGAHLVRLFEAAVAEPERPIDELPLLDSGERRLLLERWSGAGAAAEAPFAGGVHRLFQRRASENPAAPAVVHHGESTSYGELAERAGELARRLRALDVGPEARVAICLERSPEALVAVLATLGSGGAYVPLDAELGRQRLSYMLADSAAAVLISRGSLLADLELPSELPVVDLDAPPAAAVAAPQALPGVAPGGSGPAPAAPGSAAYIVYTSGSTGRPKGVTVSHGSLENAYRAWEADYGLRRAGQPPAILAHLQMASFSFDVFAGDWTRALCSGARLVICPRDTLLEPEQLFGLMVREQVDAGEFVPAILRGLLEHLATSGGRLEGLRLAIVGSDLWYRRELAELAALCGPRTRVVNSYGLSEATIDSTWFESPARGADALTGPAADHQPPALDGEPSALDGEPPARAGEPSARDGERSVPIGRPFRGSRVYLLDQRLEPVPIGVPGELFIGGAGVARGYLGRPALSADRFLPDPTPGADGERLYRTGDLARHLPTGDVEILGRADEQVKIRGLRVEPGEIEAVLAELPEIRRAVVVAREDPVAAGEKRLVAFVVAASDAEGGLAGRLRAAIAGVLPAALVPALFVPLGELPLNASGKVDRGVLSRRPLPEGSDERGELGEAYVEPRSETEEILAEIYGELLGVERVGAYDNFFDLGGHSLLATRVAARVRDTFEIDMPLRDLFEAPTVARLAIVVEDHIIAELEELSDEAAELMEREG